MKHILEELKEHIPYSVFSAAFALIVVSIFSSICFLIDGTNFLMFPGIYFMCHPCICCWCCLQRQCSGNTGGTQSGVVGFLGSVVVCGISDIVIPWLEACSGASCIAHLILEHPFMVLPFVFVGIITGLAAAEVIPSATVFSHTSHVFISSMASVLYLLSYGLVNWMGAIGGLFIIIILAVVLPCCISDIVLPLLALPSYGEKSSLKEESAPEEKLNEAEF